MNQEKGILRDLRNYILALTLVFVIIELIAFVIILIWGSGFQNALYPHGYYVSENRPCADCKGYVGLPDNKYEFGGAMMIDEYGNMVSKPVTLNKDSNTLRVILEAGSAGWGSGETWAVTNDRTYFQGTYAFESTISGLLEKELQDSFPNMKVEVINGAVVGHEIQQHFTKYITIDHLFKPDFVITFAGNNDGMTVAIGSTNRANYEMNNFIQQAAISRSSRFPFSVSLVNRILSGFGNRGAGKGIENWDGGEYDGHGVAVYKKAEPLFAKNSKPLMRVIDAYATQVKKDSGYHIFCLQPLLSRRDVQKKLTPHELKLRTKIEYGEEGVLQPYYWGMWFAPKVDSLMQSHGGAFMDMGKVIAAADEHTEIYMDYCHLTLAGNKLCANALAKHITKIKRNSQ
jgi:hypothetical protein